MKTKVIYHTNENYEIVAREVRWEWFGVVLSKKVTTYPRPVAYR